MQQETNIQLQPISSSVRSKLNVRKKQGACVEELAALISSQGLLQNLIGVAQVKRRKPTGIVEIVAGGRRLEALALLLARGQITADFLVPCKLVPLPSAWAVARGRTVGGSASVTSLPERRVPKRGGLSAAPWGLCLYMGSIQRSFRAQ